MKQKIYLVEQRIEQMGETRSRTVKAFLCKRTARKFTIYKNRKLVEQKQSLERYYIENNSFVVSKHHQKTQDRCARIFCINEYFLTEVDLH